ncbi:MAG: VWA domain-containing protein [Bryobacterales bacterium]|nr:VWA domain-containing protein [Bryobacterales bacterium]MEB2360251.1 VWA domain-containing protein [Bryobacterales bacterium]
MAARLSSCMILGLCCAFLTAGSRLSSADKVNTGQQPRVTITPRVKPGPDAGLSTRTDIRVDKTLVLINVTVTDPLNRFVTGLDRDHFRLFEDKVEQDVAHFASEDAPLSVGLVFDASGSMGSKLQKARQAAAQFFRTANPEDEFFLIQFNDRPEMVSGFTTNTEEIQNRLTFTQAKGRTALLDGVYLALNQMKKARNPRKAILIISDGGDNSSRYTESEIKNLVREADVQIYAIGIFEPISSRGRTAEELSGPGLLTEISEQTGGRHFPVENLNELPDVAAKIGIELRNQYVLGYTPSNREKDGKYRKVQIKLVQPKGLPPLRAFWRLGYYAPSQ